MMALTRDQIAAIQASFVRVVPIRTMAAEIFYTRLFAIAPHTRPLFQGDLKQQGDKLMTTLGVVVAGLDDLEALLPAARDLAARHVTYGVTPSDYEPVGQALLYTLEKGLGDHWTPELKAAWAAAYATVSEAMVEAAYPRAEAV